MLLTWLADNGTSKIKLAAKNGKLRFFNILNNVSTQMKARLDHFDKQGFPWIGVQNLIKCQNTSMTPNCRACQNMPGNLTLSG